MEEGSGQTAGMHRVILTFAGRLCLRFSRKATKPEPAQITANKESCAISGFEKDLRGLCGLADESVGSKSLSLSLHWVPPLLIRDKAKIIHVCEG